MHEHVTRLPPEARPDERGLSSSLPVNLLDRVTPAFVAPEQPISPALDLLVLSCLAKDPPSGRNRRGNYRARSGPELA